MTYARSTRHFTRLLLVFPLALLAFAPARTAPQDPAPGPAPVGPFAQEAVGANGDLNLIIELSEPGAIGALRVAGAGAGRRAERLDMHSDIAGALRARARHSQEEVRRHLASLSGVRILHSVDLVMNALMARVPASRLGALRRLPGIKKIYFSRELQPALETAAQIQNAQGMWDRAGGNERAGSGVRIGIIDSGIDIDNPMFIDNSLTPPPGFPKGESQFTNSKVIVARNYVHLLSRSQTVKTAVDERGHGTFVAGCAAGKRVTAPLGVISGMAPGAYLGSYKVFGTPGINDNATDAAVIAATEDAVADGMHVLNYSLGSLDYVPPAEDPLAQAISEAIAAGVVVVGAAGNNGPGVHTIGSPNSLAETITVGAVTNGLPVLSVTAPEPVPGELRNIPYQGSDGPKVAPKIESTPLVEVTSLGDNGLACAALPASSLTGKIPLILRGECNFSVKVANAAAAGAVAAIIYTDEARPDAQPMGGLSSTTIPAVMVSYADGTALKGFLAANPGSVRVEIGETDRRSPDSRGARVLAGFSSHGPGIEYNLKPDLVAVGDNVYSAAQNNNLNGSLYSTTQFTTASGTSFSSPMVAGAAAVIKQLHPDFSPREIKSALVNTAGRGLTANGTDPPKILEAGAGLLDMAAAAAAGAVFAPPALSFGVASYSETVVLAQTLQITNVSGSSDSFIFSVEPIVSGPSVSLSKNGTPALAPGASDSLEVRIEAAAPLTGGFQGFVVARSSATSSVYRIPYWAGLFVPDRSRVLRVRRSDGADFAGLAEALDAARPGNIVEIADSSSYSGGLVLGSNGEGLPLDGITIRAAAGAAPAISLSSTSSSAAVRIVGLAHVALQGLSLTGGRTTVLLSQYPTSRPASVVIDRCSITNPTGGSSQYGVQAPDGGNVDIIRSTISGFAATGVVVYSGGRLTLVGSTIQNNGYGGIEAGDANVLLLDSTVRNNQTEGIYLDNCTGTIAGCLVASNRGVFGEGIRIGGGRMTVVDSTVSDNDQAGISIRAGDITGRGADAVLADNRIRSNKSWGIQVVAGTNLRLERSLIRENAGGIIIGGSTEAFLANNIIQRSYDASLGDGLRVSGTGRTRSLHDTIYLNARRGLVREDSAALTVLNTIAAANTAGDAVGLGTDAVKYSLIGDGSQAGNNNIPGDPRFVDPAADMLEPGAGSPALDAGTTAIPDLPLLDQRRRLRAASVGAIAGEGIPDLGAVEASSGYPLLFPLLAHGIQASLGGDFTAGLAVLNDAAVTAGSEFAGFDAQGRLLAGNSNPVTRTFGPGEQVPILIWQLLGLDKGGSYLGSVVGRSTQQVKGFFLLFDNDFARFADGIDVSERADTDLYFMRHTSGASTETYYALFNPAVGPASATVTPVSAAGAPLDAPATIVLEPKGQAVLRFQKAAADAGYVHVVSDRPLCGLELFGDTAEMAALRAVSPGSDARLYFPHFAEKSGFSTSIGIVNTASETADLTLTAYRSDGIPMAAAVRKTLAPGAQLLESVSDLFGIRSAGLTTGYITMDSSIAGLVGFTSFHYQNGLVRSAAAVPAMPVPVKKLLFSHIAHQAPAGGGGTYWTGIALLNPFGISAPFTMRVFDGNGTEVAKLEGTIGPREQLAKYLSHPEPGAGFFREALRLLNGHVEVTSEYALLGFELFFTADFSQLASVPAQGGY